MVETLFGQDAVIYQEMMSHLPVFAHPKPQQIAILHDNNRSIEQEILKHPAINQIHHSETLPLLAANSLDILIIADGKTENCYKNHFQLLNSNGILVQQSESPFDLAALKHIQQLLQSAGFLDIHTLHFPQPSCKAGWRAAVLAVKHGVLKRPREKDIFNKPFRTRYYNLDVHKAAFALPEFMRGELVS